MESEWRVYDPRCDSPDVALRAVAMAVEANRWDLLETYDLDRQVVSLQIGALTTYYGSMRSALWREAEFMAVLRKGCPSLVPVAETWQMLYVLVTRREDKLRRRIA